MSNRTLVKMLRRIKEWNEPIVEPADLFRVDRATYKKRFWLCLRETQVATIVLTTIFSVLPVIWIFSVSADPQEMSVTARVGLAALWTVFIYAMFSHEIARKTALYPEGFFNPTLSGIWQYLRHHSYWSPSWAGIIIAGGALWAFNGPMSSEPWFSLTSAFNLSAILGGLLLFLIHDSKPHSPEKL